MNDPLMVGLVASLRGTCDIYATQDAYVSFYMKAAADRIEELEDFVQIVRRSNSISSVDLKDALEQLG